MWRLAPTPVRYSRHQPLLPLLHLPLLLQLLRQLRPGLRQHARREGKGNEADASAGKVSGCSWLDITLPALPLYFLLLLLQVSHKAPRMIGF